MFVNGVPIVFIVVFQSNVRWDGRSVHATPNLWPLNMGRIWGLDIWGYNGFEYNGFQWIYIKTYIYIYNGFEY